MHPDTCMAAERERNVCIVVNILVIGRRKAVWVELFWIAPIPCEVMQHMRVHHDARIGGNMVAAQGDVFICHARDRWLWWMQAQSFLPGLLQVFEFDEVVIMQGTFTTKYIVNFGHKSKEGKQTYN